MSSRKARLTNKQKTDPQYIFTKLSILELQKKIAHQERKNALLRIKKIDGKLKEIENNMAALLTSLNLDSSSEDTLGAKSNKAFSPPSAKNSDATANSSPAVRQPFIMR